NPSANHRSGPVKHRMKRRSGFRASGHYPRLALHRHSVSQDRQRVGVLPDDLCVPSILLMLVANRWFVGLYRVFHRCYQC
ncbi:hypothetical protein HAX54_008354, partial [Datura stramonium]|nr:hypothetical protein [Datura stramonium]